MKKSIRKFYKWLWGNNREFPPIVEWIDTYVEDKEVPALTEREVERMLDRCRNSRQRALIQVLFDGGFRIGELLNLRLRHIRSVPFNPADPTKRCFVVRVPFSKTLRRTVALPMPATTKWLALWLEEHPVRPTMQPDGTIAGTDEAVQLFPLSAEGVRQLVRRIGKQALGKRVYPHLLRHTSATFWCNRLSHFQLCKRFGWTLTSGMPRRYIDWQGVDEMEFARNFAEDRRNGVDEHRSSDLMIQVGDADDER